MTARRPRDPSKHEHGFHLLYHHFGEYGPQDVHLHPCDCGVELIGEGRACPGQGSSHAEYRYGRKWVPVGGKRIAAMHAKD